MAAGVLLAAVGVTQLVQLFYPVTWFLFIPGFDGVLIAGLAVCGLILLAVFVFGWQWSEGRRAGE